MRVCCVRLGSFLFLHLVAVVVYVSLVELDTCDSTWKWKSHTCSDYSPTKDVLLVVTDVVSQMLIPTIPAVYLHTVNDILGI